MPLVSGEYLPQEAMQSSMVASGGARFTVCGLTPEQV